MIEKVVYYVIWKMLNYIVSIFFKWNKIVRVRVRVHAGLFTPPAVVYHQLGLRQWLVESSVQAITRTMADLISVAPLETKFIAMLSNVPPTKRPWWRHQMKTFSALLAICTGNSPVPGEFPAQRPVTRSFGVFFDLRLNKRLRNNREAVDLRRYRAQYDVRHCNDLVRFVYQS